MKKVVMFLAISAMALPAITAAAIDTNLKYGARGNEVFELQEFLISKGFLSSVATGNFYSLTLKAVIAYQASVGLPTTGFVGSMTRSAINQGLADGTSTQAEITETGTTTLPITESPIDLLKKQVALLMQQIQVLQGQATTQNQILQNQQAQQAAQNQQAQQTQQQLGQIITNTTPLVPPSPTPTPTPIQPPTVRFGHQNYSQNQNVALGVHDFRISWQSSYVQSCSASGAWDGSKPANGEVLVSFNQVGTFIYSLACTGLTGEIANAALTITVIDYTPKVTFSFNGHVADNFSGTVGSTVRLSWEIRYSSTCTASGDWSGEKAGGGSFDVALNTQGTFSYTLTCTNLFGEKKSYTALVTVTP